MNTAKTRLRLARREVKAAWTRYKARERHTEGRSNVVPILGPLTWLEAGRHEPPLPAETRARIWSGIQGRLEGSGGSGDGGGGPTAPTTPAPRSVTSTLRGRVARSVGAIVLFGMGVLVGALWDPLHRPPIPSEPAASSRSESVTSPAQPPAPTPPSVAPSTAPSSSAPPVASVDGAVDVESALMDKASGAIGAGDIARALAALQEHATRFHGGGRRAKERETLWITVLARAGRTLEAREHLARFEAAYPNSPRLNELRGVVGAP